MITAAQVSLNADALNGLNLLVSFGLPIIVGIVTRKITKPAIKRNLLYALAVLTGTITTIIQNGGTFDVKDTVLGILVSYGVAQGGYSAILKPSGVADVVADATDRVGVGAVISADPQAVALEQGTIVPAPTIVPAEQVVDTEGQQAEAIVDGGDTPDTGLEGDAMPQGLLSVPAVGSDPRVEDLEGQVRQLETEVENLRKALDEANAALARANRLLAQYETLPPVKKAPAKRSPAKKSTPRTGSAS